MSEILQVVTTVDAEVAARQLAAALVERDVAACVQVDGPIQSTYRWQGAIETSEEWRLTIKTTESRYDALETAIRSLHSYDVPEILATKVTRVSDDYRRWLVEQVGNRDD